MILIEFVDQRMLESPMSQMQQSVIASFESAKWFYYAVLFTDRERYTKVRAFRLDGHLTELEIPLRDNLAPIDRPGRD